MSNNEQHRKIFYISDDDDDQDVYNDIYNLSYYDHLFGEDNNDDNDLNYDADREDNIDGNNDSDDESSVEIETSRNNSDNENNDYKSEDNNVEIDEYQFSQCYDLNLSDLNSLELEYMADIYKIESPQTISSDYDDKECDLPINPIRRAKSCPILDIELRRN